MSKTTRISLGAHVGSSIDQPLAIGLYGFANEVIRASLRPPEAREHKIESLRKAVLDGERSGEVGESDVHRTNSTARRGAKSRS